MSELFRRFTFTILLGLLGFLIGTILIFDLGFFVGQDVSITFQDPVSPFLQYLGDSIKVIVKGVIFGIILGSIFALIGLVIDIYKRQ